MRTIDACFAIAPNRSTRSSFSGACTSKLKLPWHPTELLTAAHLGCAAASCTPKHGRMEMSLRSCPASPSQWTKNNSSSQPCCNCTTPSLFRLAALVSLEDGRSFAHARVSLLCRALSCLPACAKSPKATLRWWFRGSRLSTLNPPPPYVQRERAKRDEGVSGTGAGGHSTQRGEATIARHIGCGCAYVFSLFYA